MLGRWLNFKEDENRLSRLRPSMNRRRASKPGLAMPALNHEADAEATAKASAKPEKSEVTAGQVSEPKNGIVDPKKDAPSNGATLVSSEDSELDRRSQGKSDQIGVSSDDPRQQAKIEHTSQTRGAPKLPPLQSSRRILMQETSELEEMRKLYRAEKETSKMLRRELLQVQAQMQYVLHEQYDRVQNAERVGQAAAQYYPIMNGQGSAYAAYDGF